MVFDQADLRELAAFGDEVGVLSLYTTMEPGTQAGRTRLRNEIAALRQELAAGPDQERARLVGLRLDLLEPRITELLDPAGPGIGRALFAQVAGDEVRTEWVQLPVGDLAVLKEHAYLLPLVTAVQADKPAGVARVGRDGVRLFDSRYGLAEELKPVIFNKATAEWSRGGSPTLPGLSRGGIHPDRFDQRLEEHLTKFLRDSAPHVAGQARRLGWETLLLVGDPRDTSVLAEALPAGPEIVEVDAVLDHALSPSEVLEFVRPTLDEVRARNDTALAVRARDLALSGGNGAVRLDDILSLLRQGRVEHLLLDEAGRWNAELMGVTPEELKEEMIELTFEYGGDVTMLETGAAEELAEAGGVAAMLRW
ncbi:VLRF1 family aeRF1-type release factor [Nonomuraea sp. LP-02]|uniref:VLRF1 family aeRF1-type release factor n=1 Tax=Nonomuraea sp. LP-02 TaxID=3097960 RepID=UPI002E33B567|nr:VLRF1 family aeRF1-type release factor [Nonomuraea sp. LP-02]MED7929162.1 VLRF1 family aeRF1-type release factor [Nonomuraea sp. LP-02]